MRLCLTLKQHSCLGNTYRWICFSWSQLYYPTVSSTTVCLEYLNTYSLDSSTPVQIYFLPFYFNSDSIYWNSCCQRAFLERIWSITGYRISFKCIDFLLLCFILFKLFPVRLDEVFSLDKIYIFTLKRWYWYVFDPYHTFFPPSKGKSVSQEVTGNSLVSQNIWAVASWL